MFGSLLAYEPSIEQTLGQCLLYVGTCIERIPVGPSSSTRPNIKETLDERLVWQSCENDKYRIE